jgi:hypothetical protein
MSISDPGKKRIISAGKILVNPDASKDERESAIEVISNWRARHIKPMGIFYAELRHHSSQVSKPAFVAQRLKRLESIQRKLSRDDLPGMSLNNMQDIGGCRAILPTVADVRAVEALYGSPFRKKDYIATPTALGYRGVHLILKYKGESSTEYDGMQIEIQLRSRHQHLWATAVETVGQFTGTELKAGIGSDKWLRFFRLMGSVIALTEDCPTVPGTPHDAAGVMGELKFLLPEARAELIDYTTTVRNALTFRDHPESDYYVLKRHKKERATGIGGYSRARLEEANRAVIEAEAQGYDAVLVSTDGLANLYKAYPNYFLDMDAFIRMLFSIHIQPAEEELVRLIDEEDLGI